MPTPPGPGTGASPVVGAAAPHLAGTPGSAASTPSPLHLPAVPGARRSHRRTASDPLDVRDLLAQLPECAEDEEREGNGGEVGRVAFPFVIFLCKSCAYPDVIF